jgi:hypothetical protein
MIRTREKLGEEKKTREKNATWKVDFKLYFK